MASTLAVSVSETARRIRADNRENRYVIYHAPRYAALLALVSEYMKEPQRTMLDIGRSKLTELMGDTFARPVDTLGFQVDQRTPAGNHYQFDLNDAQFEPRWRRDMPTYDVLVMAEVIEHLHTSPRLVLSFLTSLMAPGGVLIVQTPNAAALHKRLSLLVGRNPYERFREDVTNPGHFREYTLSELTAYGEAVGLQVARHFYGNYFDYRYKGYSLPNARVPKQYLTLVNLAYDVMPGPLRPGITVVLKKPA